MLAPSIVPLWSFGSTEYTSTTAIDLSCKAKKEEKEDNPPILAMVVELINVRQRIKERISASVGEYNYNSL